MALELIKKFQLDLFFHEAFVSAHAKISWAHLAIVLVAARFCEHEIFILDRSTDRQVKEKAIRGRFVKRIETGLMSLQKNCASGRITNAKQIERGAAKESGGIHVMPSGDNRGPIKLCGE